MTCIGVKNLYLYVCIRCVLCLYCYSDVSSMENPRVLLLVDVESFQILHRIKPDYTTYQPGPDDLYLDSCGKDSQLIAVGFGKALSVYNSQTAERITMKNIVDDHKIIDLKGQHSSSESIFPNHFYLAVNVCGYF